jgi:hypothetical protein
MPKPIHRVQPTLDGRSVHPGVILERMWMVPCDKRPRRVPGLEALRASDAEDEHGLPRDRRPPGWRRAITREYRDTKRREAIVATIRREDLEDYR